MNLTIEKLMDAKNSIEAECGDAHAAMICSKRVEQELIKAVPSGSDCSGIRDLTILGMEVIPLEGMPDDKAIFASTKEEARKLIKTFTDLIEWKDTSWTVDTMIILAMNYSRYELQKLSMCHQFKMKKFKDEEIKNEDKANWVYEHSLWGGIYDPKLGCVDYKLINVTTEDK